MLGPSAPAGPSGKPERRLGFHAQRPLHFGLDDELPTEPVAGTNYFAAVARQQATPLISLGATVTAAVPLSPEARCGSGSTAEACDPPGGGAAAFDWKVASASGDWSWLGQLAGSMVTGPKQRTLRDGTALPAFTGGWGFYTRAGKVGGAPLRARVDVEWASPTLELNQTGFLSTQNFARAQAFAGYVSTGRKGLVSELYVFAGTAHSLSTEGRSTYRGGGVWLTVETVLESFDFVGCSLNGEAPRYDIREVGKTGVPMGRHGGIFLSCYFDTDGTRPLQFSGGLAAGGHLPLGVFQAQAGYGGEVTGRLRPHPRLQTELTIGLDYTPHGPRFVEQLAEQLFRFGSLESHYFSATLRQQLVLTPRLTLQAWAQLFTDATYTGLYFNGASSGRALKAQDLVPVQAPESFGRSSALNLNVVLRWEYRLGSTLYAVYARSQQGGAASSARGLAGLAPDRLFSGPATDSVLVKWSWWWG